MKEVDNRVSFVELPPLEAEEPGSGGGGEYGAGLDDGGMGEERCSDTVRECGVASEGGDERARERESDGGDNRGRGEERTSGGDDGDSVEVRGEERTRGGESDSGDTSQRGEERTSGDVDSGAVRGRGEEAVRKVDGNISESVQSRYPSLMSLQSCPQLDCVPCNVYTWAQCTGVAGEGTTHIAPTRNHLETPQLTVGLANFAVVVHGQAVWVVGGDRITPRGVLSSNKVWMCEPSSAWPGRGRLLATGCQVTGETKGKKRWQDLGEWSMEPAAMNTRRSGLQAKSIGDVLVAYGGHLDHSQKLSNTYEWLDETCLTREGTRGVWRQGDLSRVHLKCPQCVECCIGGYDNIGDPCVIGGNASPVYECSGRGPLNGEFLYARDVQTLPTAPVQCYADLKNLLT